MNEATNNQAIAALKAQSEQTAAAVAHLQRLMVELEAKVDQMVVADAQRVGFWRGARFGAQLMLFAMAAALGGGVSKVIDWLSSAFVGPP